VGTILYSELRSPCKRNAYICHFPSLTLHTCTQPSLPVLDMIPSRWHALAGTSPGLTSLPARQRRFTVGGWVGGGPDDVQGRHAAMAARPGKEETGASSCSETRPGYHSHCTRYLGCIPSIRPPRVPLLRRLNPLDPPHPRGSRCRASSAWRGRCSSSGRSRASRP
jgi:hypothetical protein